MDDNTQTELNSPTNREVLIGCFPRLKSDVNFEILSPETDEYNCIAWAMQLDDRWVDTVVIPGHWWPNGVAKSVSPEALVQAFEAVGFTIAEDGCIEEDFDKVVLYKDETTERWTHASRLITESIEHSKFGKLWDGSHSVNSITGDVYGVPYCYMKRSKSYTVPPEKLQGKINVNIELLKTFFKK